MVAAKAVMLGMSTVDLLDILKAGQLVDLLVDEMVVVLVHSTVLELVALKVSTLVAC